MMKKAMLGILAIGLIACGGKEPPQKNEGFSLMSPAFKFGYPIPVLFTCNGQNISPELTWSGAPAAAKSFALISEDVSTRTVPLIHWVVYNIPATQQGLPRKIPKQSRLPDGTQQGYNGQSMVGYLGPCPGPETHRYVFRLYALDFLIENEPDLSGGRLLYLIEGHILAKAEYYGTYRQE